MMMMMIKKKKKRIRRTFVQNILEHSLHSRGLFCTLAVWSSEQPYGAGIILISVSLRRKLKHRKETICYAFSKWQSLIQ